MYAYMHIIHTYKHSMYERGERNSFYGKCKVSFVKWWPVARTHPCSISCVFPYTFPVSIMLLFVPKICANWPHPIHSTGKKYQHVTTQENSPELIRLRCACPVSHMLCGSSTVAIYSIISFYAMCVRRPLDPHTRVKPVAIRELIR